MSYNEIIEGAHAVVPDLHPVIREEIEEYSAAIAFPDSLVECWMEIGCGSFAKGQNGERLTDFQNRLIGPDEIVELKAENAFPDVDPFEKGLPFFETADLYFLVLQADGTVVHQSGTYIAESLPAFLRRLVDDPLFWLNMLPG